MAIKNLTKKLDDITKLPRPSRAEVSNILKDIYKQGVKDNDRRISKKVQDMYKKYIKIKDRYLHN